MSTDSSITTDSSEFALLPPARFTADQYVQMIEAGILGRSDHVELIDGVITPMAPAGPEHNSSLIRFTRLFAPVLNRFDVLVQGTVRLSDRQVFDPDFLLLELSENSYNDRHPAGADIHLVIESAASSLKKDLHKKLPIYAAAGIAEYWVIDLNDNVLLVHRNPQDEQYQTTQRLESGNAVSPLACPDLVINVADLFG